MKEEQVVFEKAKEYAYNYMESLKERPVSPSKESLEALRIFEEELPNKKGDAKAIIDELGQYGAPTTVTSTGGKYFGFVCGSHFPVGAASKWMADVWDQNSGLAVASPIGAKLEEVCEKWIVDLLGLPKGTAAGFVSGSSMATLCALTVARNELLRKQGYEVSSKGLFGAPELRVVLGAQAHSSVFKALAQVGLGKDRVELVEVDDQGRMRVDKLPPLDERTLLILQAGHVNTGAFDNLEELCDLGNKAGAWIHIDGAIGLWAAATKAKKALTKGLEKADSWSVDAHKTLNVPYDSGIILCKDRQSFTRAMQATGSYIQYGKDRDCMLYGLEMSRRARGIELWATLKYLGREGVDELITNLCEKAKFFAKCLEEEGFKIENEVVYNQVLITNGSDEKVRALVKAIQESGELWCGGAEHNGKAVLRLSVCSWRTTKEDIEDCVEAIKKLNASLK